MFSDESFLSKLCVYILLLMNMSVILRYFFFENDTWSDFWSGLNSLVLKYTAYPDYVLMDFYFNPLSAFDSVLIT